jgi:hypothetical protein
VDLAAEALELVAGESEELVEHAVHALRADALRQGRGADQVAEEHRHLLALALPVGSRGRRGRGRSAGAAEAGAGLERAAAPRAEVSEDGAALDAVRRAVPVVCRAVVAPHRVPHRPTGPDDPTARAFPESAASGGTCPEPRRRAGGSVARTTAVRTMRCRRLTGRPVIASARGAEHSSPPEHRRGSTRGQRTPPHSATLAGLPQRGRIAWPSRSSDPAALGRTRPVALKLLRPPGRAGSNPAPGIKERAAHTTFPSSRTLSPQLREP